MTRVNIRIYILWHESSSAQTGQSWRYSTPDNLFYDHERLICVLEGYFLISVWLHSICLQIFWYCSLSMGRKWRNNFNCCHFSLLLSTIPRSPQMLEPKLQSNWFESACIHDGIFSMEPKWLVSPSAYVRHISLNQSKKIRELGNHWLILSPNGMKFWSTKKCKPKKYKINENWIIV